MQYFEDFEVGETHSTERRTVAESDITSFVELCGLFEPIFVDMEHVEEHTPFEGRFAPGEMTLSFGLGNLTRSGLVDSAVAMLEVEATFPNPVYAGDTISVEMEILDKEETSNDKHGVLTFVLHVTNQDGEVVAEITETALMSRRP